MFGDKQATIERFKEVYQTRLTDEMRARLVLENDEVRTCHAEGPIHSVDECIQMCYNADDLLPVCEELNIPIVVRCHIRSSPAVLRRLILQYLSLITIIIGYTYV